MTARAPSIRTVVLGGAALVGVSTATTSAISLYTLAWQCGIPEPFSAALPIALDAGAAVAALAWITEQGELRRWARGIAIAALLATLVFNGIQHAITSHLITVELPLVLLVGASIPGMLFACVHLSALMARPTAGTPSVRRVRRDIVPPAVGAPTAAPVPRGKAATVGKRAVGIEWARDNWPCSGGAIALAVGCSRGEGDRIRLKVKAEKEVAS